MSLDSFERMKSLLPVMLTAAALKKHKGESVKVLVSETDGQDGVYIS